jgi:photosystem II stability/assembly factor-like uncharacterized protein
MTRKPAHSNFFSLAAALLIVGAGGAAARAGTGIWSPVGPGMGWVGTAVTHAGSPGAVWLGMAAGGVYQSLDQGTTWSWTGRPLAGWAVGAMAADPGAPASFWAATASGVFHTANGGVSWSRISDASWAAALGDGGPGAMTAASGVLYVKAGGRLLASADGGAAWQVAYDAGPENTISAVGATASGAGGVYVAVFGSRGVELLGSVDGGRTWTALAGPWDQLYGIWQIAVSPGAVYVSTGNRDLGLLRSADGGATWQAVLGGTPGVSLGVNALQADPRLPHTLWVGAEDALWITRDDGATWRRRPPAPGALAAVDPEAHVLYAVGSDFSSSAKLWRSLDGGATWRQALSTPGTDTPPARVAWRPGDPARMTMVVGGRAYLSADGGRSWSWLPVSVEGSDRRLSDLDVDPGDPNRLVGVAGYTAVLSVDGGRTWSSAYVSDYVEILVRADRRTLLAGGCGIQRSSDRGKTWRSVLPCGSRYASTGRYVQKIAVDPVHPANVYALTFLTSEFYPNHGPMDAWPSILWRSADGGVRWQKAAEGIRAFALDPGGSRVYAVRGSSLLASGDGGAHWKTLAATPPNLHELLRDPADAATFFATDGGGMLRSRDGGGTWQRFDRSNLPFSYWGGGGVYSLALSPADPDVVYADCDGMILHFAFPEEP